MEKGEEVGGRKRARHPAFAKKLRRTSTSPLQDMARIIERPCMNEEGVIYYAPTKAAGDAARATAEEHGQDAHATWPHEDYLECVSEAGRKKEKLWRQRRERGLE